MVKNSTHSNGGYTINTFEVHFCSIIQVQLHMCSIWKKLDIYIIKKEFSGHLFCSEWTLYWPIFLLPVLATYTVMKKKEKSFT